MMSTVSGALFGKKDPGIVKINNFRLEMIPEGHMALIHNIDKHGSIGKIGTVPGIHNIDKLVKSHRFLFFVIPAKAGIQ